MAMPLKRIALGTEFGFLTVTKYLGAGLWLCDCTCGATCRRFGSDLRKKSTGRQSCGCKRRESQALGRLIHGLSGTAEHRAWKNLITRCENPNGDHFERYGGRGIRVCDRWRHSFRNFYADMGPKPSPRHSIERKRLNGNYEPDNCMWATSNVQARNRSDNRLLTHDGRTKVLTDWATEVGIRRETIKARLDRGWSIARALTEKVQFMPRWHGVEASVA